VGSGNGKRGSVPCRECAVQGVCRAGSVPVRLSVTLTVAVDVLVNTIIVIVNTMIVIVNTMIVIVNTMIVLPLPSMSLCDRFSMFSVTMSGDPCKAVSSSGASTSALSRFVSRQRAHPPHLDHSVQASLSWFGPFSISAAHQGLQDSSRICSRDAATAVAAEEDPEPAPLEVMDAYGLPPDPTPPPAATGMSGMAPPGGAAPPAAGAAPPAAGAAAPPWADS
jgi:hypothetical protein